MWNGKDSDNLGEGEATKYIGKKYKNRHKSLHFHGAELINY